MAADVSASDVGSNTATTSHSVAVGSGTADKIIIMGFASNPGTVTPPSGWTTLANGSNSFMSNNIWLYVFGRSATSDTTVAVTTANSVADTHTWYVLSETDLSSATIPTAATGTTAPDPPASGTVPSGNYLCLACFGCAPTRTISAWPTNYADDQETNTAPRIGAATRYLTSITAEDPGTWSMSGANVWVAATVLIPESTGGADPIDLNLLDGSATFPTMVVADSSVDLTHLDASATFFSPTVADSSVDLDHLDAAATFFDPTFFAIDYIDLDHLDAGATFFSPTVADSSLELDQLDGSATFFSPQIDGNVDLDLLSNTTFFSPTVETPGADSIDLDLFDGSATFPSPTVAGSSIDLDLFDASATFTTGELVGSIDLDLLDATTFPTITIATPSSTPLDLKLMSRTQFFDISVTLGDVKTPSGSDLPATERRNWHRYRRQWTHW